jgi:hypothetical protein
MAQILHVGTTGNSITPKANFSITPALPCRRGSAILNQSVALSVLALMRWLPGPPFRAPSNQSRANRDS